MCTETTTKTIVVKQQYHLHKTSSHQVIMPLAAKPDIIMYRGECSVYGCYCREYVGANVGTCENCGHHYDSHRY